MKKSLSTLLTSLGLTIIFGHCNAEGKPPESAGELIVKLKTNNSLPKMQNLKSVQHLFGQLYVLRSNNIAEIENQLKNNPSIEYIERNHRALKRKLPSPDKSSRVQPDRFPFENSEFNDPQIHRVWSFANALDKGVSVNAAYKEYGTPNTTPIIVAVVDTGIDREHEDLKDVVWKNTHEIPNNGIDDDENGHIDDVYGINTLNRDAAGKATMDNSDKHSHGTHVAGTIGAKQNNNMGIAGIASNVKIMAIKTVPNNGDETDIDVAEAFLYAARNGARIINCSFGKSNNEGKKLIPETLKYIAENYGVLVVAAAGNDSADIDKIPTYPASFDNENLLIVASTNTSGGLSNFSNYGLKNVDLAAPGSSIYSTTPKSRYESMSGTSMAAPTTVGVAAEVLSHYPNLTYLQLKVVLLQSVTKVDSFKNKMLTGGRVDLLKALQIARSLQ